jgi:hypothetical protein
MHTDNSVLSICLTTLLPNRILFPLARHHLYVLDDSGDLGPVGTAAVGEGVVPDDQVSGTAGDRGGATAGAAHVLDIFLEAPR